MRLLKFFIGNIEEVKKLFPTVNTIMVFESSDSDPKTPGWTVIQKIKEIPTQDPYLLINVSDNFAHKWYKFGYAFVDTTVNPVQEKILAQSNPTIPELIGNIVDSLRGFFSDTLEDRQAFSDIEYITYIRSALMQYKGSQNVGYIEDSDIVPIKLLVQTQCSMDIAYEHARYYSLDHPGGAKLDKSEIMNHYLMMAEKLQEQYDKIAKRLNREGGGYDDQGIISQMPGIKVINAKRFSPLTGTFVDQTTVLRWNTLTDRRSL